MIYDEEGKIIYEYQSDGNNVKYVYDMNGELKESVDSRGWKDVYVKNGVSKENSVNYLFCQIFEGYWGDDWE
ncbi:hypothetical protein [Wukongibacter sp. M2B1]|uniref:hypothetical protein n=1 Tax=Wukongibacter sp. M2B1 TaxID=3088895 RepID=UPI003D7B6340